MSIIAPGAPCVNLNLPNVENDSTFNPLAGATIVDWFKYYDAIAKRQRVQAAGYSNGWACSDRTRAGKLHESNGFNVRDNLVQQLITKQYHTFLIRITWKRSGRTIHYHTPIAAILKHAERQDRYDGLQWSLPLCYWSVDGQPAPGPAEPGPEQVALFDLGSMGRVGGAY